MDEKTSTKPDVVILQTSTSGFEVAQKVVSDLDLTNRVTTLRLMPAADKIKELFDENKKQTFVTGTIHGNQNPTILLVEFLLSKYPRLTCVGFTFKRDEFPANLFKEHIFKDDNDPEIILTEFLKKIFIL